MSTLPSVVSGQFSPMKAAVNVSQPPKREPTFPRRLEERRIDALANKVSICMKAVDQIDAAMQ